MTDNEERVQRMLERFRVAAPPPGLRERVLSAAGLAAQRPRRSWRAWAFRAAVAAGLLLAAGLNIAAGRIARRTAEATAPAPAAWTAQAEEAAKLLDGDGWGRQYIALHLMAAPRRAGPVCSTDLLER